MVGDEPLQHPPGLFIVDALVPVKGDVWNAPAVFALLFRTTLLGGNNGCRRFAHLAHYTRSRS